VLVQGSADSSDLCWLQGQVPLALLVCCCFEDVLQDGCAVVELLLCLFDHGVNQDHDRICNCLEPVLLGFVLDAVVASGNSEPKLGVEAEDVFCHHPGQLLLILCCQQHVNQLIQLCCLLQLLCGIAIKAASYEEGAAAAGLLACSLLLLLPQLVLLPVLLLLLALGSAAERPGAATAA
jgi:hypothetical protein